MNEIPGHNPTEASPAPKDDEFFSSSALIEQILALPDDPEVVSNFIQQRKESLGKNPIRNLQKESLFFTPIVEGFFDDGMKIQPGISENKTFSLDDDKIYEELVKMLKGYGEFLQTRFKGDHHKLALRAVQHATTYYFGNIQPSAEQQAIRAKKFDSFSEQEAHYSIANHKEAALCSERAAVAHNLLIFCGNDSHYVGGYLNEEWPERGSHEDLHAYLLTQNKDGEFQLFDPTNPTLCYANEDLQKLETFVPFIVETNSAETPQRGQQYESQSEYLYMDNGEKKSKPRCKRTYTIGPRVKR